MNVHQENEYLREENRQLRASLADSEYDLPKEWRLTRAEQRLLKCLYSGKNHFRHEEALRFASSNSESTDRDLIKVRISQMRKKLTPHGIEIKNVWGQGYELTPESATLIKTHISTKPRFTLDSQSIRA